MYGYLISFHIIGIVLWVGGIVTLGRLLGTHSAMTEPAARSSLIPFEHKSYWYVIIPGLIMTVATGLSIMAMNGFPLYFSTSIGVWGPTFHIKMTLVLIVIILTLITGSKMHKLHKKDIGSKKFFMASHGIIGILLVLIVLFMETRILV